jgi:hypothetical protein
MFVRKKINKSGLVSVQVIDKSYGKYRVVQTIGSSLDGKEVARLYTKGKRWIAERRGERDLFEFCAKERDSKLIVDSLVSHIENILLNGPQLILNEVFKLVGFDSIDDDILCHLAVARLCQPLSKSGTVEYLKSYFDEDVELHKIYRYLDRLNDKEKEKIQRLSVEHTGKVLGGGIGLLFYDVTTLYFETDYSDELRERGFSKDGKHSHPQVVLGLLVSKDGYPLSYSLFNGAQFEGHTMLPIIEDFVQRFKLEDFVVVADSGLMNKTNVSLLHTGGRKYIIGEG